MSEKEYKEKILKSVENILKSKGIKGLTVANIARDSNISKRSFYQCFSSKEELLKELKSLSKGGADEIHDERQLILQKAEEGISLYGFNNISLETIAKSAGLSRGAIYKHFNDKYELLECCIEYQFNKINGIMKQTYMMNADNPEQFFRQYVEGFSFFLNLSGDSTIYTEIWSHLNYRTRIRELALILQESTREIFLKCLDTGMKQGVFKKDLDLEAVTNVMLMTVNGMAFHLARDIKAEKITKQSTEMILKSLFLIIGV